MVGVVKRHPVSSQEVSMPGTGMGTSDPHLRHLWGLWREGILPSLAPTGAFLMADASQRALAAR